MKRQAKKLTVKAIANADKDVCDGYGLWLQVSRSWSVLYPDPVKGEQERTFRSEKGAHEFRDDLSAKGIVASLECFVTKSWLFRFMIDGKADSMGLGPLATTTLAKAREKAQEARDLVKTGRNPRGARDAERMRVKLEAAKSITFKE